MNEINVGSSFSRKSSSNSVDQVRLGNSDYFGSEFRSCYYMTLAHLGSRTLDLKENSKCGWLRIASDIHFMSKDSDRRSAGNSHF